MKTAIVLAACLATLLLSSSCHAARSRQLLQAFASASAVAGSGETVTSNSVATSNNGQLTVSTVTAQGAGPGTAVNCEQEARNGQIKSKQCGGAGASVSTWFTAPACKKGPSAYNVAYGSVDKRPWGYEEGRSCALRGADGQPLA